MFYYPAWAVGSYRSGLSAAKTVVTKSMGGCYQRDGSPCKGVEQDQNNANLLIAGDKDALHGGHPLRHLLVPLPSIQLSLLPPVPPEVRTSECVIACSLNSQILWGRSQRSTDIRPISVLKALQFHFYQN